jgi:hypothetical protein
MTTSSRLFPLVAAILLGLPHAAAAQEPSVGDVAQARELFNEGQDLRDRGDNLAALERFKAAHALFATPVTGVELGRIYTRLGRLVEAQEAFLAVARIPVRTEETARSTAARRDAEQLAKELRARIPSLTIKVTGVPVDTLAVTIDGAAIPTQALDAPRLVDPGPHQVSARSTKGGAADTHIDVKEGEAKTVELTITFKGAPSDANPGPSAAISAAPPAPLAPESPRSSGGMSTLRLWGIVTGSVGGVGVGVGAVFAALAQSATDSQRSACPSSKDCPSYAQALSYHSTYTTDSAIAIGGFVAGGMLLTAGVAMYLAGGSKTEPAATKTGLMVAPAISPGSAGLTLLGGF